MSSSSDLSSSLTQSQQSYLTTLGWTPIHQAEWELGEFPNGHLPARVIGERPPGVLVRDAFGNDRIAIVPGKWRHEARGRDDLPAIGDWLVIEIHELDGPVPIRFLFPRKSCLKRKAAGRTEAQIIAANVDMGFIVTSLNSDLNLRRLERYLAVVWESGAQPAILLSKADLCSNAEALVEQVAAIAPGVPIIPFSSMTEDGSKQVEALLKPGGTFVVIGSSGVGKSTLVNRLHGSQVMETGGIRLDDEKGRHTTTSRELFLLSNGSILIDTPGMRELGLWEAQEGVSIVFEDIEEIAQRCRFTDCHHHDEPDCAIREALESGALDADRYASYVKVSRELAFQARKLDKAASSEQRQKWKAIAKSQRQQRKERGR